MVAAGAGGLAITDADGRDRTPRGRKARAILAFLSSQADTRIPRERLKDLLWGDRGEAQARASLRQALLEIRQATGDLIQSDRERVWIEDAQLSIEHGGEPGEAPISIT
jgi:DNA-binding SARP family transcriptional activator